MRLLRPSMAVLYHENGKLQSASFPSTKDDSSGGVLTRDQIRTCNWTILWLLNMYGIKESAVMRYTAEYGGCNNHKNNNNN